MSEPTREQKANAARTRMAELARKFLDRTAADITAMRDGLRKLESGEPGALGDIRHLAHRMVGTGATLGFDPLSEGAARIEKLAEGCAPGTMPGPAVCAGMSCALDTLDGELRKLRGG